MAATVPTETLPTSSELAERYEIRPMRNDELAALAEFIDENWRKDHIFLVSKTLLDWQHFNRDANTYNFLVGVERATGAIRGLLGFIPINQFDKEIDCSHAISMVLWRVAESARGSKLGRRMMLYLNDMVKPELLFTIGATPMTLPIYEAHGFQIGLMAHHFIVNPEKRAYQLISLGDVNPRYRSCYQPMASRTLERIDFATIQKLSAIFSAQEELPKKTPTYLENRYLRHPMYQYQVWAVVQKSRPIAFVVTRMCTHESARALRIVDFIGPSEALHGLENEWLRILIEGDIEFIDFYNAGIAESDLKKSGFQRRAPETGTIIPGYFEPFSKRNVEIPYAIQLPAGKRYRLVKGDSDQDRPNRFPHVTVP